MTTGGSGSAGATAWQYLAAAGDEEPLDVRD